MKKLKKQIDNIDITILDDKLDAIDKLINKIQDNYFNNKKELIETLGLLNSITQKEINYLFYYRKDSLLGVLSNKATIYSLLGDSNKSISCYKQAINLNISSASLYNNLAIEYYEHGNYNEAQKYINLGIDIAIQKNKNNILADLYNTLGNIYLENKNYILALKYLKLAYRKYDENATLTQVANCKVNLINVYIKLNSIKKAVKFYKELTKLGVNNYEVLKVEGLLFYILGKYQNSIDTYKKISFDDLREDKKIYIFLQIASNYYRLNEIDNALEYYFKIINIYKENPQPYSTNLVISTYSQLGIIYKTLGKDTEYLKNCDEMIELFPKNEEGYILKSNYFYENLKYDEALEYIEYASMINPNNEIIYNTKGNIYFYKKEYVKALKNFNKAYNLNSHNEVNLFNFTLLLFLENKEKNREKILKLLNSEKNYKTKDNFFKILGILVDYYENTDSFELKKEILEILLKNKFYLNIQILKYISDKIENIHKIIPDYRERIIKKVELNLKQTFYNTFIETIDIKEAKRIYYMCKGINKYTIEALVQKGVYKNEVKNFNDPFDPFFKKFSTLLDEEHHKIKITCFSQEYDNLLLWAHYGNNHKGVCLGYELDLDDKNIYFDKIIYQEIETEIVGTKKPSLDIIDRQVQLAEKYLDLKELYLRKHKDWSYEKEYRMLHLDINSKENYYKNIKLKEVIFGIDTPKSDIELIKTIVKTGYKEDLKEIKFYQMKQGKNLTLEREEIID